MRVDSRLTVHKSEPCYADVLAYCKKNLTLTNPDYAKKARMHFWLGDTSKTLCLYEIVGDDLVLPFGTLREVMKQCEGVQLEDGFGEKHPVDFHCSVPLYDYQREALRQMITGHYGILQSPAGTGKTQMGIALVAEIGCRALWLCTTLDLVKQSKARAEMYMSDKLIGTITEGKVNIGKGITFATIQTMCKLNLAQYRDYWDVIIVDECFVRGTLIATPNGNVPIETITAGALILTRNEVTGLLESKEVEEIQQRTPLTLGTLMLSNGATITCTLNHPLYTKAGYKSAGNIQNDDEVLYMWEGFPLGSIEQDSIKWHPAGRKKPSLLKRMCYKSSKNKYNMVNQKAREVPAVNDCIESQICVRTDENAQPDVLSRSEREGFEYVAGNEAPPHDSGWKWARFNRATKAIAGWLRRFLTRCGVCGSNRSERARLPNLLQNRHCNSGNKSCNRSRRRLAWVKPGATSRQEENGFLEWVRVAGLEIHQSGSDRTFGGLCREGQVYNLAVKDNHNYFANGCAVHNCHRVAGTPTAMTQFSKVLNALSARHKIGLSATVHRSDGMIEATHALLGEVVYTVPEEAVGDRIMRVGIKPVSTGVEISRECLNTDGTLNYTKLITYLTESQDRNNLIASWIVEEQERSSLILSDRLLHLEKLMAMLPREMREQAVMISGKMTSKTGKAKREQAIEDMRTGKKKYLFATYALAKEGLDIPRMERLFLTTPVKDKAVVIQSVGRVARAFEEKCPPVAFDFVDNIQYCAKAYKQRLRHYRSIGTFLMEE